MRFYAERGKVTKIEWESLKEWLVFWVSFGFIDFTGAPWSRFYVPGWKYPGRAEILYCHVMLYPFIKAGILCWIGWLRMARIIAKSEHMKIRSGERIPKFWPKILCLKRYDAKQTGEDTRDDIYRGNTHKLSEWVHRHVNYTK